MSLLTGSYDLENGGGDGIRTREDNPTRTLLRATVRFEMRFPTRPFLAGSVHCKDPSRYLNGCPGITRAGVPIFSRWACRSRPTPPLCHILDSRLVVREAGFDPAISCFQGRRITKLSHSLFGGARGETRTPIPPDS